MPAFMQCLKNVLVCVYVSWIPEWFFLNLYYIFNIKTSKDTDIVRNPQSVLDTSKVSTTVFAILVMGYKDETLDKYICIYNC